MALKVSRPLSFPPFGPALCLLLNSLPSSTDSTSVPCKRLLCLFPSSRLHLLHSPSKRPPLPTDSPSFLPTPAHSKGPLSQPIPPPSFPLLPSPPTDFCSRPSLHAPHNGLAYRSSHPSSPSAASTRQVRSSTFSSPTPHPNSPDPPTLDGHPSACLLMVSSLGLSSWQSRIALSTSWCAPRSRSCSPTGARGAPSLASLPDSSLLSLPLPLPLHPSYLSSSPRLRHPLPLPPLHLTLIRLFPTPPSPTPTGTTSSQKASQSCEERRSLCQCQSVSPPQDRWSDGRQAPPPPKKLSFLPESKPEIWPSKEAKREREESDHSTDCSTSPRLN